MIQVELQDAEVRALLDGLAAALTDMSLVMGEIGEAWLASTQDRVQAGLQPDGTPFAPRSQTTIDRYAKTEQSYGNPLNTSGVMRSQIHTSHGADYVEIASNAIQAAVMQFGAEAGAFGARMGKNTKGRSYFFSIPWGDIPARPFLGISDDDREMISETVDEWLKRVADKGQ